VAVTGGSRVDSLLLFVADYECNGPQLSATLVIQRRDRGGQTFRLLRLGTRSSQPGKRVVAKHDPAQGQLANLDIALLQQNASLVLPSRSFLA